VDVGQRIRQARKDAGLSQTQLAARLGSSQATVSYAERSSWVRRSVLERYAQALRRPLSYFLVATDESPRDPREAAIETAFEVVKRDPDFQFGARDEPGLTLDTKRDIVRLYEQARRVYLLPREWAEGPASAGSATDGAEG
jgi:transcriptional regulator with XRE-family HTH domain